MFCVTYLILNVARCLLSCTLNEGKSFEAAFVIAHEMAHRLVSLKQALLFLIALICCSLGILHDGRGNNCDGDKYIMSEKTG